VSSVSIAPVHLSQYISYSSYYNIFYSLFHNEQWFYNDIENEMIDVSSNSKKFHSEVKKINLNFDVGLPVKTFTRTKSYENYMKSKPYQERKNLQQQVAIYLGTNLKLYINDDARPTFFMFERLQQDSKIILTKFRNEYLNCSLHQKVSSISYLTFISQKEKNHKECKKIIISQIINSQLNFFNTFKSFLQIFKQNLATESINTKWKVSDPIIKKILENKNKRFSKSDEEKIKKIIFQKENKASIIALLNQFEESYLLYNKKYVTTLNNLVEKNVIIERKTEKRIFLSNNRFLLFFLFIPVYFFIFFYLFNIKNASKKKYKI